MEIKEALKQLSIYNTLTRKKELFKPINYPNVGLYVCGQTVYSEAHIGNVRTFVTFDVVFRYLTFLGHKVRYVRNITDVGHLVDDIDEGEDKIDASFAKWYLVSCSALINWMIEKYA